ALEPVRPFSGGGLMMRSVVAFFLALAIGAAAPAARAQQPDAARQDAEDQIQLGTQEVLLEVVVTDDGKPVTDLRADEVQVFENGERQEMTSFALVQSGAPGGAKAPLSLEMSPFRGFNYVIIVIDRTSLNQRDLDATYKA